MYFHHHLLLFEFNSFKKCFSSCFIETEALSLFSQGFLCPLLLLLLLPLLPPDTPKIGSVDISVVDPRAVPLPLPPPPRTTAAAWFVPPAPIVLKMASYCFCGRFTKSFTFGTVSVVLKNTYR